MVRSGLVIVCFETCVCDVQPIYGFASGDPMRFKRAAGHRDLFYVEDKDVDFKEVWNLDFSFLIFLTSNYGMR